MSMNKLFFENEEYSWSQEIMANPLNCAAYVERGWAYDNLNERSKAILDFRKAIRLNPHYAEAHYQKGISHYHSKNYDKGRKCIRRAKALGFEVCPEVIMGLRKYSRGGNKKEGRCSYGAGKS